MKTSRAFVSLRASNSAALPVLVLVDIAPDVLATALLAIVAAFLVAASFIFAVRRPSPTHKFLFDALAHMDGNDSQHAPTRSHVRPSHRMSA